MTDNLTRMGRVLSIEEWRERQKAEADLADVAPELSSDEAPPIEVIVEHLGTLEEDEQPDPDYLADCIEWCRERLVERGIIIPDDVEEALELAAEGEGYAVIDLLVLVALLQARA